MTQQIWIAIISGFFSLAGGLGLGKLIFYGPNKKKANAEADNLAIEGFKETVKSLTEDNNRLRAQEEAKDAKIDRLLDEKDLEREGRVAAEQGYCRHFGCVLREPAVGQGREWLEAHKADPAMGADYLPINQLLQKYGQEKKTKEA
ncbi:MAG: hypothetical protein J5699_04595 [Bacteroidales bacterium]|nr:hypothetical protein [Bacteroidales bacterium]